MKPAAPPTVISTVRSITAPVWVLLVGTFVNTLGSFLMLYLTLYLTQKGLSPYYAGLALGAWGVGRIVGAFVGGSIADRLGYRITMVVSMMATAVFIVGLVAAANQRNPWLVVVTSLVAASVGGIWRPPAQAMLTELTPPERLVMVTAVWRLSFNAGMFAAPVLGALLSRYSWDLLFWVEAGSSAIFGLFILIGIPRDPHPTPPVVTTSTGTSEPAGKGTGYLRVLADGTFVLFLVALLVNAIVYVQAPAVLALHLHDIGHPTEVFGAVASLNALMVIILEIPVTKAMQRFQARTAIAIGMALTGIGLSFYSLPLGLVGLVLATIVWTMGEVTASPSMMAYPGLAAPPAMRGRYIAAATVANQAGYSIGPVVGTAVWAGLGGHVFWICGVLSVVAIAAVLAGTRTLRNFHDTTPASDDTDSVTPAPSA
ncbi:MFS transporter [Micromonospora polyrhachis]